MFEKIRNSVYQLQMPIYVLKNGQFEDKHLEEYTQFKTYHNLVVQYIVNLYQEPTTSQAELDEVFNIAKTKDGVMNLAIGALVNINEIETDYDLVESLNKSRKPQIH